MRECLVCSKDITNKSAKAKYCSDECKAKPIFHGTYCLCCASPLLVRSSNKNRTKFCSIQCSKDHAFSAKFPSFNEDYFAEPNLENSYWAGFLAADGYITDAEGRQNRLGITLKSSDQDHLFAFQKAIGAGNVYFYEDYDKRLEKITKKVTYRLSSQKICDDLEKVFNITPRKTLTCNPPSLEGDLAYAFIAGYIDGDGSYSYSRSRPVLAIAGTRNLLAWIAKICGVDKIPREHGNIYTIHYHGNDAINVRALFQGLSIPLLKRKRNRWEELGLNLNLSRR